MMSARARSGQQMWSFVEGEDEAGSPAMAKLKKTVSLSVPTSAARVARATVEAAGDIVGSAAKIVRRLSHGAALSAAKDGAAAEDDGDGEASHRPASTPHATDPKSGHKPDGESCGMNDEASGEKKKRLSFSHQPAMDPINEDAETDEEEEATLYWGLISSVLMCIFAVSAFAMVKMLHTACVEQAFASEHTFLCEGVSDFVRYMTELKNDATVLLAPAHDKLTSLWSPQNEVVPEMVDGLN